MQILELPGSEVNLMEFYGNFLEKLDEDGEKGRGQPRNWTENVDNHPRDLEKLQIIFGCASESFKIAQLC